MNTSELVGDLRGEAENVDVLRLVAGDLALQNVDQIVHVVL